MRLFSVNVDKLIKMTPEESKSYAAAAKAVLKKAQGCCGTIGVVGGEISSFKLASALMEQGNRVLFMDADITENVFLNKYRLGKNLKGLTNYLAGEAAAEELICVTNREKMDIIFTGPIELASAHKINQDIMRRLFAECLSNYDYVVVQSDDSGKAASFCDGTVLFMEAPAYSETAGEVKVDTLNGQGCVVLGVIIDE